MSLSNNFYVYEHCRADTGAVFYVGKGCGSRAKNFNNRGRYWNNVASKAGGVIVSKPVDGVDEELAHLAEIELIDAYRRSGFRLANITDGGEGTSGWIPSEKTRKRIGEANKHTPKARGERHGMFGKKHTPESLAKMSASQKGRMAGENHPFYGKHHTDEAKAKVSIARKGKCVGVENPFYGKTHSPEAIAKIKAAHLGKKQSTEEIERRAQKLRKPILCLTNGQKYSSATEACRLLDIDASSITACCRGRLKTAGKMRFAYAQIER